MASKSNEASIGNQCHRDHLENSVDNICWNVILMISFHHVVTLLVFRLKFIIQDFKEKTRYKTLAFKRLPSLKITKFSHITEV